MEAHVVVVMGEGQEVAAAVAVLVAVVVVDALATVACIPPGLTPVPPRPHLPSGQLFAAPFWWLDASRPSGEPWKP
jgi:hypothetical protein